MSVILLFALLIVSLLLTAMIAAYGTLSTSHLRHWARQHDPAASKLYPLKARGSAAFLTLELFRAILLSITVVFLANNTSAWLAGLVLALIFFIFFALLAQLYLKPVGIQLLIWLSSPILSVTHALRPVMLPLGSRLDKYLAEEPATLTRSDLRQTLRNVAPEDTDLTPQELSSLSQILKFSVKNVHDTMLSKRHLSLISINEVLTPVVLDELHKSGQDYFPVMATDNKTVDGVLYMQDVMDISHNPSVAATMRKVQFVDENQLLADVVEQYYATKQPVFIATNGAGNIAGLISMDMVLKEIIGVKPEPEPEEEAIDPSDGEQLTELEPVADEQTAEPESISDEQIAEPEPDVVEWPL